MADEKKDELAGSFQDVAEFMQKMWNPLGVPIPGFGVPGVPAIGAGLGPAYAAATAGLPRGTAVVFTTRDRPVRSSRGWSAAPMRHGVSVVRRGARRIEG